MILEHFGFGRGAKHLTTTGSKHEDKSEGEHGEIELDKEELTNFRAITARAKHMTV